VDVNAGKVWIATWYVVRQIIGNGQTSDRCWWIETSGTDAILCTQHDLFQSTV